MTDSAWDGRAHVHGGLTHNERQASVVACPRMARRMGCSAPSLDACRALVVFVVGVTQRACPHLVLAPTMSCLLNTVGRAQCLTDSFRIGSLFAISQAWSIDCL